MARRPKLPEPVYTELSRRPDLARLDEVYRFDTGITGYHARISDQFKRCELTRDGILTCHDGLRWDFGSGAFDDRSMRTASLAHDCFCWLTDAGKVPWSVRAQADAYFRKVLRRCGSPFVRAWWCWRAVRWYSVRRAKGKALPYDAANALR